MGKEGEERTDGNEVGKGKEGRGRERTHKCHVQHKCII